MRAVGLPVGGTCSACRQLRPRAARPQAPRIARAPLRTRAIAEAEKPVPAAAAAGAPLSIDITQVRLPVRGWRRACCASGCSVGVAVGLALQWLWAWTTCCRTIRGTGASPIPRPPRNQPALPLSVCQEDNSTCIVVQGTSRAGEEGSDCWLGVATAGD